jgi:hypothetical protein
MADSINKGLKHSGVTYQIFKSEETGKYARGSVGSRPNNEGLYKYDTIQDAVDSLEIINKGDYQAGSFSTIVNPQTKKGFIELNNALSENLRIKPVTPVVPPVINKPLSNIEPQGIERKPSLTFEDPVFPKPPIEHSGAQTVPTAQVVNAPVTPPIVDKPLGVQAKTVEANYHFEIGDKVWHKKGNIPKITEDIAPESLMKGKGIAGGLLMAAIAAGLVIGTYETATASRSKERKLRQRDGANPSDLASRMHQRL